MAAPAFPAHGFHWPALAWNRYRGDDPRPKAGTRWPPPCSPAVCVADCAVAAVVGAFERVLGLVHTATGCWLRHLTVATVLDTASGHHLPA